MPADISGPEAQAPPVTTIMAMELTRVLAMTQNGYVRALVLLCRPLGAKKERKVKTRIKKKKKKKEQKIKRKKKHKGTKIIKVKK
jgi:hypothetical protein